MLIEFISDKFFGIFSPQRWKFYRNALITWAQLLQLKFFTNQIWTKLGKLYDTISAIIQFFYILYSFTKQAFSKIVLAVFIVFLLKIVEQYMSPEQRFFWINGISKNDLVSTYGVFIQISGLILALYFTAISAIVITIYSKIPDNIRHRIAEDKLGDNYVYTLILLSAISLIELGTMLLDQSPSVSVLCITLFLLLLTLLTLPLLIRNIFSLDPARLAAKYAFPVVINWARKATCEYRGWDNRSSQTFNYESANQSLSTYKIIVNLLTQDHRLNNASLMHLMAEEFSFLSDYVEIKRQIPTDSRWYQYQEEHPKWLETDYSSANFTISANKSLTYKKIPDHLWIEKRTANNLRVILSHLLDSKDIEHAVQLIGCLRENFEKIVKMLALKEAYFLTDVCDKLIVKYLSTATLEEENKAYHLALADFYGANHVNISIESAKILEEMSPDNLKQKLQSIDWNNIASVYKTHLPASILPSLEDILQRKQNQFIIDRSVKTPQWYDLELIAIACLKFLHEITEQVVSQYEKAFIDKIKIIEGEDNIFLMQILTKGLEGYNACLTFLSMAEDLNESLQNLVVTQDIPHPTLSWSKHKKKIRYAHSKVMERFGACASTINPKDIDKTFPDYIGHAYWMFAQESFLALCKQDEERYKNAYKTYMKLMYRMWAYYYSISDEGKDIGHYMSVLSEISIDAMVIGGYAKLFNEFGESNCWKVTENIWDEFLESSDRDGNNILNMFLDAAKYKNQQFLPSATNRSAEREKWKQEYNHIIRNKVDLSDNIPYYQQRRLDRSVHDQKKNILLRAFEASGTYHAESVFIYSYILQKPGMENTTIDQQTEQFIESLNITIRDNQNTTDA